MKNFSFWDVLVPHEINFFRLPMYAHFRLRPYHAQTVHVELEVRQMREDLAAELVRSEGCVSPDHKAKKRDRVRRLLFRLADDVFCYAEEDELTIAPTRKEALEHAERLSVKYGKEKPAELPRFYLLKIGSDSVHAEGIEITRRLAMNSAELGLHYGSDLVEFEDKLIVTLLE